MTTLYIANTTQQVQDFQARVPEIPQVVRLIIPIGGQAKFPMDLNPLQVEAIVSHHSVYGLVNVSEIDRTKEFVGLCYRLDKPVDIERIKYAILHNFEVLEKRGAQIRKESAVSVALSAEEQAKQIGASNLNAMEFSVEEVETQGRDKELETQTIRVDRSANPDETPRGRGRSRRAA